MKNDILKIKKSIKITDYITTELTEQSPNNWKTTSPFTDEKTPSFFIKEENGIQVFKCFSSGKSGDIFSFLMESENKVFSEVFKDLAEKIGISTENSKIKISQKKYFEILNKINLKLRFNLSENTEVLNYLIHERQINPETIDLFNLGWANDDILHFIISENIDKDLSAEIGILGKTDNYFSKIKNRITIPLFSQQSNIIGIATRKYYQDDNYGKYILPNNSSLFKKNNFLFGLNFAQEEIKKEDGVILVEGHFDVITLHQNGIKNSVGICGTNIYSSQVKTLQRFTNNFYLCLDGDKAGYRSIIKNCKELIKQNIDIFIIELTDNLDPDEYIKINGVNNFKNLYKNAKNFFEFLKNSKEELIDILEELSLIIPKIESTIKQQFWYQNIEKYTGIDIRQNIKKSYYNIKKDIELTFNDTLFLKLYINSDPEKRKLLEKNRFYETEFGKLLFLKIKNTKYKIEFTETEQEFINSITSSKPTTQADIDSAINKNKELNFLDNI